MELNNVLLAFGLTLFAGLSTGIGSAIAFFAKKTNTKLLAFSLGLSAGVMIYISFVELFTESFHLLQNSLGEKKGSWIAVISFFTGMGIIALIDKLVPERENPHEMRRIEDLEEDAAAKSKERKLLRTGIVTALVIAVHNFPEGAATFVSSIKDITLGIPIAVAIAIHNIPEGIAVSVPVFYSTGSRKKAFKYSFLSGLSEPVGALLAYLILMPFFNDTLFGIIYASVAGIMVFISLDELLPSAQEYGEHHLSIYGLVLGMFIMGVSLLII